MNSKVIFKNKKTTSSAGRRSIYTTGVYIANQGHIVLKPINSRGNISISYISIPQEDIGQLIEELTKFI